MERKSKAKAKKKPENKRRCLLCKEVHEKQFCPIVFDKLRRYRYSKKQNFFMANVLLECIHKKVNFPLLLREFDELVLEYHEFTNNLPVVAYMDVAVEYFAAALDCSPSKFFKNSNDTIRAFMDLLSNAYPEFDEFAYNPDEEYDSIDLVFRDVPGLDEVYGKNYFFQKLTLKKIFYENDNPNYSICALVSYPYDVFYLNMGTCSCTEIELIYEEEGELKDYFEQNCDYDWTNFTTHFPLTDDRFKTWINRLFSATQDNLVIWRKLPSINSTQFRTEYGNVEVKLCFTSKKSNNYSLYMRADKRRGMHFYWKEYEEWELYNSSLPKEHMEGLTEFIEEPENPFLKDNSETEEAIFKLQKLAELIEPLIKMPNVDLTAQNKVREKQIEYSDTVVVASSLICNSRTHSILPYTGIIKLLSSDNTIINYKIYVGYCRDCDKYYIFDRDYKNMLKEGTPLCNVYDRNKPIGSNNVPFRYKSQSVLNAMGYTVSKNIDLNSKARQKILTEALQKNLFSIHDLLDFLNWLVSMHKNQVRYSDAVDKWNEDIEFVEEYRKNERKTVHISSVYR